MGILKDLLQSISLVKGTLTFWAFFISAIVIVIWIVVRSDRFHLIWSNVVGSKLKGTHVFKILRLFLVLVFCVSVILILLVFLSPLLLENLHTQNEIKQDVEYLKSKTDRVLKEIVIAEQESEEFKKEYRVAREIMREDKDYELAITTLKKLRKSARANITRASINGLITHSYYKKKDHEGGLKFICESYKSLPAHDCRYRFDIHAHLRRIALEKGFAKAESIVSDLYATYKRKDLSYVWLAIPLAKMEFLRNGQTVLEENYYLSAEDRDQLKYVISRYPSDQFLDHAYYFLHDFKTVVKKYPNSLILGEALLACGQDYDQPQVGREYLNRYLELLPETNRLKDVKSMIYETYCADGDLAGALNYLSQNAHDLKIDFCMDLCAFSERPLSEILTLMAQPQYDDILKNNCSNIASNWPCFDKGGKYFAAQKYDEALAYYKNISDLFRQHAMVVPGEISTKIEDLNRIVELNQVDSPEAMIELALLLRRLPRASWGMDAKYNAIKLFDKCAERYPETIEAEKAIYLKASVCRQIGKHEKSEHTLSAFIEKYPNSYLADDAVGEIGVYYLLVKEDPANALNYFNLILERYPNGNAADNALNWIAWSYLNRGKYSKSIKFYSLLASDYLETRLGKKAVNTAFKLARVMQHGKKQKTIAGLEIHADSNGAAYVETVENGSHAEKIGIHVADFIVKINNYDTINREGFFHILSQLNTGDTINLLVFRGRENYFRIKANVTERTIYQIRYGNWAADDDVALKLRIEDFAIKYLVLQSSKDIDRVLGLYGKDVEYYNQGRINKDKIRDDKRAYYRKWPLRQNTIDSDIEIETLSGAHYKVRFSYHYYLQRGHRTLDGQAWCELVVIKQEDEFGSEFRIIKENGGLIKKPVLEPKVTKLNFLGYAGHIWSATYCEN